MFGLTCEACSSSMSALSDLTNLSPTDAKDDWPPPFLPPLPPAAAGGASGLQMSATMGLADLRRCCSTSAASESLFLARNSSAK